MMDKYELYKTDGKCGNCYVGVTNSVRSKRWINKVIGDRMASCCNVEQAKHRENNHQLMDNKNSYFITLNGDNIQQLIHRIGLVESSPQIVDLKGLLLNKLPDRRTQISNYVTENKKTRSIEKRIQVISADLPTDPDEQLSYLHNECELFQVLHLVPEADNTLIMKLAVEVQQIFQDSTWRTCITKVKMCKLSRYSELLKIMKGEVSELFQETVNFASIEYFSLDPFLRRAFEANYNNASLINAVQAPIINVIRAPVLWHQRVLNGTNFMQHNLFLSHPAILRLGDHCSYFFKCRHNMVVCVNDLKNESLPLELNSLEKFIVKKCFESRRLLLNEWFPECVGILTNLKETWEYLLIEEPSCIFTAQAQKFFNTIHCLVSRHIRDFVVASLRELLSFVSEYKGGNYFRGTQIHEQFLFLKPSFLNMRVKNTNSKPYIKFCPTFREVTRTFQQFFWNITQVACEIPSLERYLFPNSKSNNIYMRSVKITEGIVQEMLIKCFEFCEMNFLGPMIYVNIYQNNEYKEIMNGETENNVQHIIKQNSIPNLKVLTERIDHFTSLRKSCCNLRNDIGFNMLNLNCKQINMTICNICLNICNIIINNVLIFTQEHNERIACMFDEISQKVGKNPESTKALVELSNYINKSKSVSLVDLKRRLSKSSELIAFLMDYAIVPESLVSLNTKVFRWPRHLEHILEMATNRVSCRKDALELSLRTRKSEFSSQLEERMKELETVKKKDPPILTLNETKETDMFIRQYIQALEEDKKKADDINMEEELLDIGVTSYQQLYDIIKTIKPFHELYETAFEFQLSSDKWYNGPFKELNAEEVKECVERMWQTFYMLSKIFHDVPGSKRVAEIMLSKVEKFRQFVPVLQTICNPGLQARHWKKISDIAGIQFMPTSSTTLSEVVTCGLSKYIFDLEAIGTAATEEYKLEQGLRNMKTEWNDVLIQSQNYRDTEMQILAPVDEIQLLLDDHLLRVQTMRGSPFINAVEEEIETWEDDLISISDILDVWLQVQNIWMYLEPLFSSEDIMRQMPDESNHFNRVNIVWNDIMNNAVKNPRVVEATGYPNMIKVLKDCKNTLDEIKKRLNDYLGNKRLIFPRFFFLSNRELLEILSESKDFSEIHSHLKCFEGISSLDMTENFDILGIISENFEVVPLNSAVSPVEAKGIVERWLDQLEDLMIQSLCDINNKAVRSYYSIALEQWIFEWPAMVTHCAFFISWTSDVENAFDKNELPIIEKKYKNVILQLISMHKNALCAKDRFTVTLLIPVAMYVFETIREISNSNTQSSKSIHWLKRLRYYNKEQKTVVQILGANLNYGYEYLGNCTRLILTPQTERYYRLMAMASNQNSSTCLAGASGSGKSETCKDFSRAVAKPFCLFQCSEKVGYRTISTFLKGSLQMGAWICFDKIDQMKMKELEMVAEEIRSIQDALTRKCNRFKFGSVEIPVNFTCNFLFTLATTNNFNKIIPVNFRTILRPILTSNQDLSRITNITLISLGINNHESYTKKILDLHQLSNQLIIGQRHYVADLRSIKHLLRFLDTLKNQSAQVDLEKHLAAAMKLVYGSKYNRMDENTFRFLCDKLLGSTNVDEITISTEKLKQLLEHNNITAADQYMKKIKQLYHALKTRHAVILLGPSISGKSSGYKCLASNEAASAFGDDKVQLSVINPRSLTLEQLYGYLDDSTGEWADGVVSKIYQDYAKSKTSHRKWIVFDGTAHNNWTDEIKTVLDENKKLCLVSGEIIKMNERMSILFETDTLDYVSPSMARCCSIVCFDEGVVNWRMMFETFVKYMRTRLMDDQVNLLQVILEWLVPAVFNFVNDNTEHLFQKTSNNYMFKSFSRLFAYLLDATYQETGYSILLVQHLILFSILWSFTGYFNESGKYAFDTFYRSVLYGQNEKYQRPNKFKLTKHQLFPERESVYHWMYNDGAWFSWIDTVDHNHIPPVNHIGEIYVYNNKTAYLAYFLKMFIEREEPSLIIGESSSGKTATVLNCLNSLTEEKYITNVVNFSATTSANILQNIILSKVDRRRKGVYGPAMGKKCVLYVEDFDSSSEDASELLRQLIEHKFCYHLKASSRLDLIDIVYTSTSTVGRSSSLDLNLRLIHHVFLLCSRPYTSESVNTIFTKILDWNFTKKGFSGLISRFSKPIVMAILDVYDNMKLKFIRRSEKAHYIFNLRDVYRVINGICLMSASKCQSLDEMFRLWTHEMLRVFGDRLTSYEEKEQLLEIIKISSSKNLRQRTDQYLGHLITDSDGKLQAENLRSLFFGNYLCNENELEAYDEVTNVDLLLEQMKQFMMDYSKKMGHNEGIVSFKFAVECTSSIIRALQLDTGNVLIIGVCGSGRKTVIKLASFILKFNFYEIEIKSTLKSTDWHEKIKKICTEVGLNKEGCVLLVSTDRGFNCGQDQHLAGEDGDEHWNQDVIIESTIYCDLNSLLNTADLSYILSSEERSTILNKMMDIIHDEHVEIDTSPASLYSFFISRLKKHLHIAIILSPFPRMFNHVLEMYPSFYKCCSLFWLMPWPEDALKSVASEYLSTTSIRKNDGTFDACVDLCPIIHSMSIEYTRQYAVKRKTELYVTSESYLKFLTIFRTLYNRKIASINETKARYELGLEKLSCAEEQVLKMKKELMVLKPELLLTSDATEKLMVKIEQNTMNIETTKEVVAADEALANEAAAASQAIRDDCETDLSEAEPALISATNALNTLKSSDITVIKSMKNPPSIVKLVLEAVCVMKAVKAERRTDLAGKVVEDYWTQSLKLLSDAKFLDSLKTYDKDNIDPEIMTTIRKRYICRSDFDPFVVKKVSNACEGLCKWVQAMEIYDRVIKIVRPKKIKLAEAEADYTMQMEKLNDKRAQLTEVLAKLQTLRDELAEKTKQKKELEDSIELCTLKLERAEKLIDTSLGYEKVRWSSLKTELENTLIKSVGDMLMSSACITYLAPLLFEFRKMAIEEWKRIFANKGILVSSDFSIGRLFVDNNEIRSWNMANLPTDSVFVDNIVMATITNYIPLIIDPQGLVENALVHLERESNIRIIKRTNENYSQLLEQSLSNGDHILLKDVDESIDDMLMSIILRKTFESNGIRYLKYVDRDIVYNEGFKLYFTTSLENPYFHPQITNKVTLINFEITENGLAGQLLKIIISIDAPELKEKNNQLLAQCAKDSYTLRQTENRILDVLSSSQENILEDETALETLSASKVLLEEIRKKQLISIIAEEEVINASKAYSVISKYATRLYFAVSTLKRIRSVYNFSLDWFLATFTQVLKTSKLAKLMEEHIEDVNESFISQVEKHVRTCALEADIPIVSFVLAGEISRAKATLKNQLLMNIPRSNTLKPVLNKIPFEKFKLAAEDVSLKKRIDSNVEQLSVDDLLKNVVLCNFQNGSLQTFIQDFVGKHMYSRDCETMNLYEIYNNADRRLCIMCMFTDDVDPVINIHKLAVEIGISRDNVKSFAFVQNQLQVILNEIRISMTKGNWLVIQNCYIRKESLKYLEYVCDEIINTKDIHPHFRLWLTSIPFCQVSSIFLSRNVKVAVREAKELYSSLQELYVYSSLQLQQLFEDKNKIKCWLHIYFFVCVCHSILKLSWSSGIFSKTSCWSFSLVNLNATISFLQTMFDDPEKITVEELIFLMNECNYSANLSNDVDKSTLFSIIGTLYVENFENPSCLRIFDKSFPVPDDISFNGCLRHFQSCLSKSNFKFYPHSGSALTHLLDKKKFVEHIENLYSDNKTKNLVKLVKIVTDLSKLILPYYENLKKVQYYAPLLKNTNFSIFFKQEIMSYIKLSKAILTTITDIYNAEDDTFSTDVKSCLIVEQLMRDELPMEWIQAAYPTSMKFQEFSCDLIKRLTHVDKWLRNIISEVIWLPAVFNVAAIFNIVAHERAQLTNLNNEDIELHATITDFHCTCTHSKQWSPSSMDKQRRSKPGIFIQGLQFCGRYKEEFDCLENKTNLSAMLPVLWIEAHPKVYGNSREVSHRMNDGTWYVRYLKEWAYYPKKILHFFCGECAVAVRSEMITCPFYVTEDDTNANESFTLNYICELLFDPCEFIEPWIQSNLKLVLFR